MPAATKPRLTRVSKTNPCIHCGKPDWCYTLSDLVLKDEKSELKEITVCNREAPAAPGWVQTREKAKQGGFYYIPEEHYKGFKNSPQKPLDPKYFNDQIDDSSTTLSSALPLIELARVPDEIELPKSWQEGDNTVTIFPYSEELYVKRVDFFDENGEPGKVTKPWHLKNVDHWKIGLGGKVWPAYRVTEAAFHGKGRWILAVEGETCVDTARKIGVATITWQGASWGEDKLCEQLLFLKEAGIRGLCYWRDNDDPGMRKQKKVVAACQQIGLAIALIDPTELWPEVPEKGDIANWIEAVELGDDERIHVIERTARQLVKIDPVKNVPIEEEDEEDEDPFKLIIVRKPKLQLALKYCRSVIGDRVRFNEQTQTTEINGEELDLDHIELYLACEFGIELKVGCRQLESIIHKIAKENSYNPVRDYLDNCHAKHNDTSIFDDFAHRYFGTSNPIFETYIRKTLIAAVARIFRPGTKVDTALILQSQKQGMFKSTFFKVLAGENFFCDDMGDFKDKDERLKAHQSWFTEWPELETTFGKKANSLIKAYMATDKDLIRPSYARKLRWMKRRFILVGTTNETDFLTDPTGHRREWVIKVEKEIPIDLLRTERDQIWGAAVELYKRGEQHWLTKEEQKQSSSVNEHFREGSVWEDEIASMVAGLNEISTGELIRKLGLSPQDPEIRRVERQLRQTMVGMGWEKDRVTVLGKRVRGYRRIEAELSDQTEKESLLSAEKTEVTTRSVPPETPTSEEFQLTLPFGGQQDSENQNFFENSENRIRDFYSLSERDVVYHYRAKLVQLRKKRGTFWETSRKDITVSLDTWKNGTVRRPISWDVANLLKEKPDRKTFRWLNRNLEELQAEAITLIAEEDPELAAKLYEFLNPIELSARQEEARNFVKDGLMENGSVVVKAFLEKWGDDGRVVLQWLEEEKGVIPVKGVIKA